MDKHNFAYIIDGMITIEFIILLSLFVSSQSASAKWFSEPVVPLDRPDNLNKKDQIQPPLDRPYFIYRTHIHFA